MAETNQVYTSRVSGFWNTRHEIANDEGRIGVLAVRRNGWGMVVAGSFQPEKGEVYELERNPGLVRSQFTMWTDTREWLGSAERRSYVKREILVHAGGRPYRLLPSPGLGRGWTLYAPKTGEAAIRIEVPLLGRGARLEVLRKLEFPLLVFTYFLGCQVYPESIFPGPTLERAKQLAESSAV